MQVFSHKKEPVTPALFIPFHQKALAASGHTRRRCLSSAPCNAGHALGHQWNCSSSVEPVRAFTLEVPPWMTVVTSSK